MSGDGTRGPEWAEMEAPHAAEGTVRWHAKDGTMTQTNLWWFITCAFGSTA